MNLEERIKNLKKKNKLKQVAGLDALIELVDLLRKWQGDLKEILKKDNSKEITNAISKLEGTFKDIKPPDYNKLVEAVKNVKVVPQVNVTVDHLKNVEKLLKELKQEQQADDRIDIEKILRELRKPKNAIAVRLTKKDADEFYNALMTVIGGGGGGGGIASIPLVKVLLVGQAKIAVTGTAVQLPANSLKNGVIIGALSTNSGNIAVGNSDVDNVFDGTGRGRILEPGAETSFAVDDTNRLYINGDANDLISFAGS